MSKKHKKITRKDKVAQSGEPDRLVMSIIVGEQVKKVMLPAETKPNEPPHSHHKQLVENIRDTIEFGLSHPPFRHMALKLQSMITGLSNDQLIEYVVYNNNIYSMNEWERMMKLKAFL